MAIGSRLIKGASAIRPTTDHNWTTVRPQTDYRKLQERYKRGTKEVQGRYKRGTRFCLPRVDTTQKGNEYRHNVQYSRQKYALSRPQLCSEFPNLAPSALTQEPFWPKKTPVAYPAMSPNPFFFLSAIEPHRWKCLHFVCNWHFDEACIQYVNKMQTFLSSENVSAHKMQTKCKHDG